MTWMLEHAWVARRGTALGFATLAAFVAGCGDDGAGVSLALDVPASGQVLTAAEDTDPVLPGVQLDVVGHSHGIGPGAKLDLYIDDELTEDTTEIEDDGAFTFHDATLPAGTHTLFARTPTGSAFTDKTHSYTLRTLQITAPVSGAVLGSDEDQDPSTPGMQINVSVQSFGVELDEDVTFEVDGSAVGTDRPDADGVAVLAVTLDDGDHVLLARVFEQDAVSGEVQVSVEQACAQIRFVTPRPRSDGAPVVVGGSAACPAEDETFVMSFEVATDAGNGQDAELLVEGTPVAMAQVDGSTATFEDVPLALRGEALDVVFRVVNAEGVTCESALPGGVLVDCDGPGCALVSPVPLEGVDAAGDPALYINASVPATGGYALEVATDSDQAVRLIIDGDRDNALSAEPTGSGDERKAVFSGVALAEGARRIQAECTDAVGNLVSTGRIDWIVDTVPCTPSITDPVANARYVPADDTDTTTDETDVVTSSALSGADCSARRAGRCDPAVGLSGDFVTHDGTSPLLTTITLDSTAVAQTLCVETQDRAGNLGRGSVNVSYVTTPPVVAISSPASGTRFNKLGNDVAGIQLADKDPATPACELDVVVDCSAVGTVVELYRNATTPMKLAEAPCLANGAAPNGGRVTFTNVAPFIDTSVELYAVQPLAGAMGTLPGTSPMITLHGLCEAPTTAFVACPANPIQEPALVNGLRVSFNGPAGAVPQPANALTTDASSTVIDTIGPVDFGNGTSASHYELNDVSLLPAGTLPQDVTLRVTVSDQFDNQASASCTSNVRYSPVPAPTVSILSPSDGRYYNRTGSGTMHTYTADKNPATATCELDVSVRCSHIGRIVELWRNPASPFKLGQANCTGTAPNGTASFTNLAPFVTTSVTIYATQINTGPGGSATGTSATVTLNGQCQALNVGFDPCPAATLTEPALLNGIAVSYAGPSPAPAAFLVTEDSNGTEIDAHGPVVFGAGSSPFRYEFNGVSFLPSGTLPRNVTATVTVTDEFENSDTDACTSSVQYAPVDPPVVAITSPVTNSYYNRTGVGSLHSYTADANAATPGCELDLRVDCSEVGRPVELFRNPSSPVKITEANCVANAAAPNGGRVTFNDVMPFGSTTSTSVFARQTATGPGGSATTSSVPVTLHGLCDPPVLTFSPCPGSPLIDPAQLSGIEVTHDGPEAPRPALLVTTDENGTLIDTVGPVTHGAASYVFNSVSFLPTGALPQDVTATVSVQDSFENSASDSCLSVVEYAPTPAPIVGIASPANNSYYNAAGAGTMHSYIADKNSATAACELDLVVNCSELGAPVELFRDPVTPVKIGEVTCTMDMSAPNGGRASFSSLAPFTGGNTTAALFATQTATGPGGDAEGSSSVVTLRGLCDPPELAFDACPASFLVAPATLNDLRVSYTGPEAPAPARLVTTESGGGVIEMVGPVTFGAVTANRYEFDGVDFTPTPTPDNVTATVSVKDSFENPASATCTSLVDVDAPTITIATNTPSQGATFGPNAAGTCVSGVAGRMGVTFNVTVDRVADRSLSIEVDDVDLTGMVTIAGLPTQLPAAPPSTSFPICVPVPDGAHKVDLELVSTRSSAMATPATRNLTLRSVVITTPSSTGPFLNETCDSTSAFELTVNVNFDKIHGGSSFTLQTASASTPVNGVGAVPAGGGAVNGTCVPFAHNSNDLLVRIGGTEVARLDDVIVVAAPPSSATAININSVTFGSGQTRRTSGATLAWSASEDFPGQLVSYILKCAPSITPLSAAANKNTWWSNVAVEWDLSGASNPPEQTTGNVKNDIAMGLVGPRIGEPMDCAMRAVDIKGQLTPLPAAGDLVHFKLLEQVVTTSNDGAMGMSAAPVGDVNGDGANDVLIGGQSRAYLYFGTSTGVLAAAPAVVFEHPNSEFGQQLASLGDVNADGRPDFALGFGIAVADQGTADSDDDLQEAGAVYVYYGRGSGDPWPPIVDLASGLSSGGTQCANADVCIEGSSAGLWCGLHLSSAGLFNDDSVPDLAFSCPGGDLAFVLLGTDFEGSGPRADDFHGVRIAVPADDPWGFQVIGGVGANIVVPLGNRDGQAGDDLGIVAYGQPGVDAKLYLLGGEAHSAASGLDALVLDDFDVLESGPQQEFPSLAVAVGNVRDTSESDVPDLMLRSWSGSNPDDEFYLYMGDENASMKPFAPADRIEVVGPPQAGLGVYMATGFQGSGRNPLPDLDGDSLADIVAISGMSNPDDPSVRLFYADTLEQSIVSGTVTNDDFSTQLVSHDITPAALSVSYDGALVPAYLGDVTGDGMPDLLIGAPGDSVDSGKVMILY